MSTTWSASSGMPVLEAERHDGDPQRRPRRRSRPTARTSRARSCTLSSDVSMTVSARSRRSARIARSSAMPSRMRPLPCSGCGRRTCSNRRTSTSSEASRNRIAVLDAGLAQPPQHRRQVAEELAAAHVDDGGEALRAGAGRPAGEHADQVREHLGRQVVDDVPVEVLEHRGRTGAARARHAGDDQDLRLAQVGRLGGRLEGGDPGGHRDRRRLVAHASSMPADSGTWSDAAGTAQFSPGARQRRDDGRRGPVPHALHRRDLLDRRRRAAA